jgi:hypothetical protein
VTLIAVRDFAGMRPKLDADSLTLGGAVQATNVRLTGKDVHPLKDVSLALALATGAQVKSIYRFGQQLVSSTQYWFQSTLDVDFVKGPVDLDTTERTYFTDGVFPKKTDSTIATGATPLPTASYAMGLPAPAAAPTVTVTGSATNPADPGEAVVFCYTYVSPWGEEGPPSAASAAVTWRAGQTLNVSALATAPGTGAAGQNYNVSAKRLYRSATGTSATQFQLTSLTGDIALATTTFTDTTVTANLGAVLATLGWLEPPVTMIGLCAGPNGIMAGFTGNTLCFSVPFAPYAWPVRYQQSTDAPIVGIAWMDQTLFVGTTQGIYLFSGADPSAMTSQKLAAQQSVASKRSIVHMMGAVIFASPDGLYKIDATGLTNITDNIMTRANWQAYVPSSINAYESDNRYVAYYNNGSKSASMIFEFDAKSASEIYTTGDMPIFSECDNYAFAGYRDRKADTLYVVDSSNQINKFDAGAAMTYTWQSGVFHLGADECPACASVDASAYPVTFKLYVDGTLTFTQSVTSKYAFRLPSGYRSRRFAFSVAGTASIRDVRFAESMDELEG